MAISQRPRVVVAGGTYIDMAVKCAKFPSGGQTVSGSGLSYTTTGAGPVQAIQAAMCGCEVSLISKLGADQFAQMAKETLTHYHVDTSHIRVAQAKNTGVAVTMVNAEGENAGCICTGANNALLPADIEAAEDAIAQADICLIDGKLPADAVVAAVTTAQVHATKIILNPAGAIATGHGFNQLSASEFGADIIIPNLYEAADITERSGADIRHAKLIGSELVARGVKCAIITMGRRGCMIVERKSSSHVPAFEIELVDHTCSGDAFAGALAAACAVGDKIEDAVKFASAAGALACTKFGSVEALPTKADIIELLQR